jgi:glycosyltransferase involved in cell wall biosynthesis
MSKILLVSSLASSLTRFRGDLIRDLRRRGHEVAACAPEPDADTVARLHAEQVAVVATPLHRANISPLRDLAYLHRLRETIKREAPDVVLAYTPKPVVYSGVAARAFPSVRHYALISGLGYAFGTETLAQRLLNPVMATLYRMGLARSKGVIFQNPDDRRLFIERGLVEAERAVLVHGSGVDTDAFALLNQPPTPTFLLMARLIPEKGVREYVEAARRLKSRAPEARCLLAGWIEPRRGAITAAELDAWRAEGIIEYLGSLEDVRPAIARASVYVLPSYYREGVPRSVLEAMSMGRAVITTDMPGCRETVVDGVNGFLTPPRDSSALAARMEQFARVPALAARMGLASRRIAEDRFAVTKINRDMLNAMGMAA